MKKAILFLLLAALALSIAACGGEAVPITPVTTQPVLQTEAAVQTLPAETTVPVTEPEITFEELTVIDSENCLVKVTGITPSDPEKSDKYILHAILENRTSDRNLNFYSKEETFNSVQCVWSGMWGDEAACVSAGERVNADIAFYVGPFLDNGFNDFTDIELTIHADDMNYNTIASETVHIYPYGEERDYVYERTLQSTDIAVCDGDDATVIITGINPDSKWGYAVNLYIVNKTDEGLCFEIVGATFDGVPSDAGSLVNGIIGANKTTFDEAAWPGISQASEIEMEFKLTSLYGTEILRDSIKFNP